MKGKNCGSCWWFTPESGKCAANEVMKYVSYQDGSAVICGKHITEDNYWKLSPEGQNRLCAMIFGDKD